MRLRPTDGQSLLNLAGIYGQLQMHKDAARAWEMYLALDPGNFEAHVQRGTHLLMAGETDKAAAALKTALELQPGSARAYQILGDIYARAERVRPGGPPLPQGPRDRARQRPHAARPRRGPRSRRSARRRPSPRRRPCSTPTPRTASRSTSRAARCATSAASTRPRPWPTRSAAADPKDLKAAYLKVTIAESRRDFAGGRGPARGDRGRGRRPPDEEGAGNRPRLPGPPRLRLPAARALPRGRAGLRPRHRRPATRPTRTSSSYHAEALYLAKQKDEALAAVRAARAALPRRRRPRGPRGHAPAREGRLRRGDAPSSRPCARRRRHDPKVLGRVADFYRRAEQLPEAEAALRQALAADPKNLARALPARGGARAPEAPRRRRGGLPRGARDRARLGARAQLPGLHERRPQRAGRRGARAHRRRRWRSTRRAAPTWTAWAGRCSALDRLEAAEQAVRRALEKDGENAVSSTTSATSSRSGAAWPRPSSSGRRRSKGEDEEGELDRPRVEAKIREAQGALPGPAADPCRRPRPELALAGLLLSACADGHACRRRAWPRARPPRVSWSGSAARVGERARPARPQPRPVAFRRPDALRIEIPGPPGARLMAVARGGRLTAVLPAERAVLRERGHGRGARGAPRRRAGPAGADGRARRRGARAACATTRRSWGDDAARARSRRSSADGTRLEAHGRRGRGGPDAGRGRLRPAAARRLSRVVDADEARRLLGGR